VQFAKEHDDDEKYRNEIGNKRQTEFGGGQVNTTQKIINDTNKSQNVTFKTIQKEGQIIKE
jgi:hypothetical protein